MYDSDPKNDLHVLRTLPSPVLSLCVPVPPAVKAASQPGCDRCDTNYIRD